jgi:putative hemolysin
MQGAAMQIDLSRYRVKLADTEAERAGAQRLRYRVFVEEMGAVATPEQRAARREWDAFDPFFDHLILLDETAGIADPMDRVVGVYRLMRDTAAAEGPGFYGAAEYDLAPIAASGRRSVELGRSCVAREHRGGPAMHLLWNGLAEYVLDRDIEILFGVASFPGTDPAPVAEALAFLHHFHLAPPDLRVRARPAHFLGMDRMPGEAVDPARALRVIPALIKAYLRVGGFVGEGAWVDRDFNTIDVCVVMDTGRMTERYHRYFARNRDRRG